MNTNFDIDVLRTFIESVRHKSLANAAERRAKSASTVTLQIQRLEQQIGAKLFQRAGRGVVPTEHALRLLPYAERIVLANDEGLRTVGSSPSMETIRIAAPADIAEIWLPRQLSDFLVIHSDISVEAQVLRNSEIIERIDNGEADVALHWSRSGDGSTARPAATFPIEWMAAASFSADPQRAWPIVVLQSPCLFRDLGVTVLEKANEPLRITMATTGVTGLWSAVAAGLGITCRVPLGAPEGVVRYQDERLPALGAIDLALRTSRTASAKARDLEAYLMEAIRKL
ncbi:LysR substrate-binding domain-containing protein [Rhizobium puerariae]|uniref:LysR substrate-binding domain-containing protein n=1 Tax=Rhizobium puerariae TaxID=1585791 RepID=A0ABV6AMI2_9HYPH